jgi:osmotically-inducible protein OsmY
MGRLSKKEWNMNRSRTLSLAAAALLVPLTGFAQVYTERIVVYDPPKYLLFVDKEDGAIQSGGKTLPDTLLADDVAMALARDKRLDNTTITVSASNGRVTLGGLGSEDQSTVAQSVAKRVAGSGNVRGALSNDAG